MEGETNADTATHHGGMSKGEEQTGDEPGRHEHSGKDGDTRPSGTATARSSTSIRPEDREPIDPRMPHMPPA